MLLSDDGHVDTPHVKKVVKTSPPKADHKHEYFRYVTFMHIRRFDGTISSETYKYSSPAKCIDCDHVKRRCRNFVEIDISPKEWKKLRGETKGPRWLI